MIRFVRNAFLPLLAAAALAVAISNVVGNYAKIEPPQPFAPPAVRPFERSVAGTGIVEARTENIAIGSHTGGIVAKVLVRVGQQVKPGDALFSIDDRQLKATLHVRQAALRQAEVELQRLQAMPRSEELVPSAAKIREAKANLAAQEDLYNRAALLLPQRAITDEEYVSRKMLRDVRKQQLARAEAEDALIRAGAWEPEKEVTRAAAERAKAEVEQAATDVERLTVRAPVAGEILQVNIRAGEFVASPQAVPPIVLGDTSVLHVRVDIDEHDISRLPLGAPARASVRGDSQQSYPLTFVRVEPLVVPKRSLAGDSAERVDTRVLQVIYAFAPDTKGVYVGQQMDVFQDASTGAPSGGLSSH